MKCNLCGSTEFRDVNARRKVLCARCGSYERTRLLKLYVDSLDLPPTARVLHLAPESGLYHALRERWPEYVAADVDVQRYSHISGLRHFDLMNLDDYGALGTFDLIVHSHVIEHLRCNYTAVLVKLHKLLRASGHHLFSVPVYGSFYEESLAPLSPDEATRRFGQFDHVRRFSASDIQSTIGAIFRIPPTYQLKELFTASQLRDANVPVEAWAGYSGHSVFHLRPSSLRI